MLIKTDKFFYHWYSGSLDNVKRDIQLNTFIGAQQYPESNCKWFNATPTYPIKLDIKKFLSSTIFFDTIKEFYIAPKQVVKNVGELHQRICELPIHLKWEIFELFLPTTHRKICTGSTKLTYAELYLLELIKRTVYIENGHPSELWFSIIFNGKVCGAVADEGAIESDVMIDNIGISLKNYKDLGTVDLGTMPTAFTEYLSKFISLNSLLLNMNTNKSISRVSLTSLLDEIDNHDWDSFKQILLNSPNDMLRNIYRHIIELELNGSIRDQFIHMLNSAINEKISTVQYWSFMVKDYVHILHSDVISQLLKSESSINNCINHLKQNKMYISGVRLIGELNGK